MYPINTIDKIPMSGTKYINIVVVDSAQGYHIATYYSDNKTFKDFNTQQVIEDAVMWDFLPTFNLVCFERQANTL
jgi:hypothetical protein